MGTSIYKVPRNVRNYHSAKHIHDTSAPVRGRHPEIRPLGARRNVDTYSVRMNGDNVEFVLYKTPVVTYRPDGTIAVRTGGYNTTSTRMFISWVLEVGVTSKRHYVVMAYSGAECILPGQGELVFKVEDGRLTLAGEPPKYYGYKMKRKVANSVRARFKPFYDYMRGFVSLRAADVVTQTAWYRSVDRCVTIGAAEALEMLGLLSLPKSRVFYDAPQVYAIDTYSWEWLMPVNAVVGSRLASMGVTRENTRERFIDLISAKDDDPDQAGKFHKALIGALLRNHALETNEQGELLNNPLRTKGVNLIADAIEAVLDEIILRAHAGEVLERVELKQGATPNPKYVDWV